MDQSELQAAVQRLFRTAKPGQVFRTYQVANLLGSLTGTNIAAPDLRQALYALPDFAHPRPARGGDGLAWAFGVTTAPAKAASKTRRPPRREKSIAESQRLKK